MKRFSVLFYSLICIVMSSFGQVDDLVEAVRKSNEQVKSFNSKFTELQYRKSSRQSQDMSGKIYFDAIGRLAMLYSDPEGDYIIIDGTTYLSKQSGQKKHYSTDKKGVIADFSASLIHSLNGEVEQVAQANNAEIRSKADNQYYTFTLTRNDSGKKKKQDVVKIVLRYSKRTSVLVYMSIEDRAGNTTTYALQHPQLNVAIPDNVFIPK